MASQKNSGFYWGLFLRKAGKIVIGYARVCDSLGIQSYICLDFDGSPRRNNVPFVD
jgi:hypothetical protein